jgi:hypothetical protein
MARNIVLFVRKNLGVAACVAPLATESANALTRLNPCAHVANTGSPRHSSPVKTADPFYDDFM